MLATATQKIAAAGLDERTHLAYADAADFDPQALFGRREFDRIFISYAVSMIPQWQEVIREAVTHLTPGGALHIVDFGDLKDLPGFTRTALYKWLEWYHVTPRNNLFDVADTIAAQGGCSSEARRLYRGFAWISVVRRKK